MRRFNILSAAKPILRSASRASIQSYFNELGVPHRDQFWLTLENRYRVNCVSIFEDDAEKARRRGTGLSTQKHKHLKAYVGASAPAHAIDGWSFLGRAIDSVLRGDTYAAAHFAYYAELRAAMALLATEGFGIFSGIHAVVGETRSVRFPQNNNRAGTHSFVWPLLQYWSALSRAADLLDDIIQPDQIRLSHWLNELARPVPMRALGKNWLSAWGIDLAAAEEDHSTRNLASYRPSQFRYPAAISVEDAAEFVCALWRLFEPGQDRRFQSIERYLLRIALRAGVGANPTAADIEGVGISQLESANWERFLAANDDPMPLSLAADILGVEDSFCHLCMVSRAALLLFVASSASRQLLISAGYSSDTVRFWWSRHGIDRGLWSPNNLPANPMDLWADIATVLDEVTEWVQGNGNASLREFRHAPQSHIQELGAFELVGVWSLLP